MKTIDQIIEKLNDAGIQVDKYKEGKTLCGYELNTYTEGGVNQIVFVDFRNTDKNPKKAADFLALYNERVNSIDIDEEIEINRQDKTYCKAFTLTESVVDFKDWKTKLQNIFTKKSPQQRQFEQVTDKLRSLLNEMEETLNLMPKKGNRPHECQRITISNQLGGLDMCINGIELEDFTPNEYSGDFKLSYS